MLSDNDIIRELGRNIFLAPVGSQNIKGAFLNLTASQLAWNISTRQSCFSSKSGKIILKANDTTLIETNETISITAKLAGCFHSKVNLVSQGIGHVSTPLEPGWIGPCLISLQNNTLADIAIDVGDSITILSLFYTNSESTRSTTNKPGRPDALYGISLNPEEKKWLEVAWRNELTALKNEMDKSPFIQLIKKQKRGNSKSLILLYCLIACVVLFFAGSIILINYRSAWNVTAKDFFVPMVIAVATAIPIFAITIVDKFKNW